MSTGSASVVIDRPARDVWDAIADITRIGEWSPECVAGRWTGGATGPAVGATFEGDNVAKFAGRTVKKWTTTSKVTASEPGHLFEFIAEEYTTWRYELLPSGAGTRVTESFSYEAKGYQGFVYDTLLRRPKAMTKGVGRTLDRLKAGLEASA
jgi:Polyketide cyclase / dehydrase and lipid transport